MNPIQVGTIMAQPSANLQAFGIKSNFYAGTWQLLEIVESSGLDRRVRAAGWKLFFIAGELRTVVPAWGGDKSLSRGVRRLLARTRAQHFNCMELTNIARKHFLGVPFISIAAHSRHIQQGSEIQSLERRTRNGIYDR